MHQLTTFRIQQSCNSQLVLRNVERIVQVSDVIGRVQRVVVDKIRSVGMDERVESESAAPACREIVNLNTFVPVATDAVPADFNPMNPYSR